MNAPAVAPKIPAGRLSLYQFHRWLESSKADLHVFPYGIVACHCGDVNCKGWRLVPSTDLFSGERNGDRRPVS